MLSSADTELAGRDPSLPGLRLLLDPEALAEALSGAGCGLRVESADLGYLRYKPGTNCVASYAISTGGRTRRIYAKAFGPDAGPKLKKALWRAATRSDTAPILLREPGVVVCAFPLDLKLRVLGRLGDPLRRDRLLARVLRLRAGQVGGGAFQILAYKPERRCVARLDGVGTKGVVVRLYASPAARFRARRATALRSVAGLRLARRVGGSKPHQVLALEWLPGRSLRDEIRRRDADLRPVQLFGTALAALHTQSCEELSARKATADVAALREGSQTLGFLCPPLAERATRLSERLAVALAVGGPRHPTHGDLYDKQVLVDGDRASILDLDQAALADVRSDLGLFIAHLERDRLEGSLCPRRAAEVTGTLLESYRDARREPLRGIEPFVAAGLMGLAHHPFRQHLSDWPERIEAILATAEDWLVREGT